MKSGGPWNLRGLRPEARAAARDAARRSGMSVGEWLNTVIQPADEDEAWLFDAERHGDERGRPRSRYDDSRHGVRSYRADYAPDQARSGPQRRGESSSQWRTERARDASVDHAVAEIEARQRALDGEAGLARSFSERQAQPFQSRPGEGEATRAEPSHPRNAAVDISNLDQQLRQITARIEALRPAADLETAINGLRADLAEIGRTFTEALPQRAVESLETEIKTLAQRIDQSRKSGADTAELAGIERGLAEVRQALGVLTPAEGLTGFDEAVKALAKKVDGIIARDDPAALQQLEAAISALRGIVSHVASNDTLNKVADDVRALAAKVDGLANSAANLPTLSTIENRIDTLTSALNASTEAGHAVPRELEKLLSGLIEKLEWVQLTHTDHTALAHLEDRIAALVKRLDVSDARLGALEGVERGLADLLVFVDQLRGKNASGAPVPAGAIEHEVAEIRQTERRTEDSLEDMQGTVEHVVGRLAKIESDMRSDKTRPLPAAETAASPLLYTPTEPPGVQPAARSEAPKESTVAPALPTLAPARTPIDPNLPPNHPLEPGSATRSRPSAADRIAASEAIVGSKPPIIPDPGGGKSDFIAAARRAAKAAAVAWPEEQVTKPDIQPPAPAKTLSERLRTLAVAAAVTVIVVGAFHTVARLLTGGASAPPAQTAPARLQTERPQLPASPLPEEPSAARIERPQVETEPPSAAPESPASAGVTAIAPEISPAIVPSPNSAPAALPPLDADSPPTAAPQSVAPNPSADAPPGQQSQSHTSTAPYAMTIGPPIDITGSLPSASVAPQRSAPAPNGGDTLPLAIGPAVLRTAALAGDPAAAYEVGVRFAEGRVVPPNNVAAAHWLEIAAGKGLAPAQFRLGTFYEKGLGVRKNLATARDLYRAAADKGHGKAMHNLAVLYAEGTDGRADYRTAAQWFRKAAERGITDSQYNLAVLYARGVGVEQNFSESYKWFFLAAKEGDQDAAEKRDEIASRLDQQALAAARAAAEAFTPVPQPVDVVTVKGAWDAPASKPPAVKPKSRSAKSSAPDAVKVD